MRDAPPLFQCLKISEGRDGWGFFFPPFVFEVNSKAFLKSSYVICVMRPLKEQKNPVWLRVTGRSKGYNQGSCGNVFEPVSKIRS